MARKDTQTLSLDFFGTASEEGVPTATPRPSASSAPPAPLAPSARKPRAKSAGATAAEQVSPPGRTASESEREPSKDIVVSPALSQLASNPVDVTPAAAPEPPEVLSVSGLGRALKGALDRSFADKVLVEGEAVGVKSSPTGHLYFTLKDEQEDASIDVVMYKATITPRVRQLVSNGARLRLRGKPTYWSPRGRLQFVADRADLAGVGALLAAVERLKAKLEAEGLFARERKRTLPAEPRIVGVVTSRTGAVIHDIRKVAFRRGGARILLAPASVQGAGAAESIVRALTMLQQVAEVDVIIIGRGGGSLDDLMAFNDEAVVRAIAACSVPIVSAVGHEVDVTLSDFAADLRAATPSQAAEFCVPDTSVRRASLLELRARLLRAARTGTDQRRLRLERVARKMEDPRLAVANAQSLLDDRSFALMQWSSRALPVRASLVASLHSRLGAQAPAGRILRQRAELASLHARACEVVRRALALRGAQHGELAARLDALSPLAVLGRGYALARTEGGKLVRRASDTTPGDVLQLRLEEGEVRAKVLP